MLGNRSVSRLTAIISAVIICLMVSMTWAINHYRGNAITYKDQRDKATVRADTSEAIANNVITTMNLIRDISQANPRTGNSDNTMKANNPRNAFYWRFVEMGTVNMPPHPFIRPAFDVRQEQATEVAIRRMNQAIDEALSK